METIDSNDDVNVVGLMPRERMTFKTVDDAFHFYNNYAKMKVFGIRKGCQQYGTNGIIVRKVFVCAKEGHKRKDDPREIDKDMKRKSDIREGCMDRMVVKINNEGEWSVHTLDDKHSHAMTTPSKVGNIRSHKQFSEVSRKLIHGLSECGIGPSHISRVLNHVSDGVIDGEYTSHDCRNQLAKSRKNNMGQQFLKVHQYFQSKAGNEEGFYFKMQIDEDYSVRSVFWADMRSRQAYMQFADVLVFYVTYNTNAFKMPFAPFTGVNHHRQSTLFGCALLANETKDTFRWLFETWLECMWGKAPQSIITDQDGAIKDAISIVFPHTQHRFCSWHIAMNAKIHLREFCKHEDFTTDYNAWRFSDTPEECEEQWIRLKGKYGVVDESWLHQMYIIRKNWLDAYLKDYFFAGMTSTQRSESINAFFDGYVNAQTTVAEFVTQYEKALNARRKGEALEDYRTMQSKPAMHIGSPLEKMAREVYTRKLFTLFRAEYKDAFFYSCHEMGQDDWGTVYRLARKEANAKFELVTFSTVPKISMECTCKKFEVDAMLCRHILRVMVQMDMDPIPEQYILFRWTIGARYASSATLQTTSHLPNITPTMLFTYQTAVSKISNSITVSPDFWNHGMPILKDLIDDFDKMLHMASPQAVQHGEDVVTNVPHEVMPGIVFVDPAIVRRKGRPKGSSRLKSSVEISQASQSKQQRRCGNCGNKVYYSTTCPQDKGKLAQISSSKRPWSDVSDNENEDVGLSDSDS